MTDEIHGTTYEGGDGPTIVFLHSLGLDRTMWDDVVASLRGRYPMMVLDLPGHGASPLGEVATVEAMADLIATHLRSNGVSGAVIVGQSLGGFIAQVLAAQTPDLVTGLVLIATTAWYGENSASRWAARAQAVLDDGLDALPAFQRDRWFSQEYQRQEPATVQRLLDILPTNDPGAYAAGCHVVGAFDGRHLLADIDVPAVVIVGEHDAATPPGVAQVLVDGLRDARLRVLAGRRHLCTVEEPQAIVDELNELVRRL